MKMSLFGQWLGEWSENLINIGGECNLLISMAAILDPRCEIRVVEFSFARMYSDREAKENIVKFQKSLYDIFEEYAR